MRGIRLETRERVFLLRKGRRIRMIYFGYFNNASLFKFLAKINSNSASPYEARIRKES